MDFRNFTLRDKQKGWLRRKEIHDIMESIDQLGETNVDEVPEGSIFLLEVDYDNLMKSNIHNKTYWVVAMETAIKAGQRKANRGVRGKNPTQEPPAKIDKRERETESN